MKKIIVNICISAAIFLGGWFIIKITGVDKQMKHVPAKDTTHVITCDTLPNDTIPKK